MSDVSWQRPEYAAALPQWNQVEHAAAGEAVVKAQGEAYLPRPNAQDKSPQNLARYEAYKARAVYYNATGRTLEGLVGLAFGEWPEMKLGGIEFVETDVTGSGVPVVQQAQQTLGQVLKTGRAGLLADFPATDGNVSKRDEKQRGVRPTITYYPAAAIINWRVEKVGSEARLSMVVLAETHETNDGFATKSEPQMRVLKLEPACVAEIWRKVKDETTGHLVWTKAESFDVRNGAGQQLTEIPFTFVGAKDNDWGVDDAPLYHLAVINLAHYRNSADHEDSVFLCGQPQYYVAGLTVEWRDHMEKKGHYVGSRAIMMLPAAGSAGILQAEPNSMVSAAMKTKEEQMASLGARLIQQGTVAKTATQQGSEDSTAHSVLSLACKNVSDAYTKALTWLAAFAGVATEPVFQLVTDFSSWDMDAATSASLILQMQQGGLITKVTALKEQQRRGVLSDEIDPDDEVAAALEEAPAPVDDGLGGDGSGEEGGGQGAGAEQE